MAGKEKGERESAISAFSKVHLLFQCLRSVSYHWEPDPKTGLAAHAVSSEPSAAGTLDAPCPTDPQTGSNPVFRSAPCHRFVCACPGESIHAAVVRAPGLAPGVAQSLPPPGRP